MEAESKKEFGYLCVKINPVVQKALRVAAANAGLTIRKFTEDALTLVIVNKLLERQSE